MAADRGQGIINVYIEIFNTPHNSSNKSMRQITVLLLCIKKELLFPTTIGVRPIGTPVIFIILHGCNG